MPSEIRAAIHVTVNLTGDLGVLVFSSLHYILDSACRTSIPAILEYPSHSSICETITSTGYHWKSLSMLRYNWIDVATILFANISAVLRSLVV
jgi:hypothetical protein